MCPRRGSGFFFFCFVSFFPFLAIQRELVVDQSRQESSAKTETLVAVTSENPGRAFVARIENERCECECGTQYGSRVSGNLDTNPVAIHGDKNTYVLATWDERTSAPAKRGRT